MAAIPRRSPVPWLYGLSVLLVLISPLVFLGVWVGEGSLEGIADALLIAIADLVAAAIAAIVATVMAARRGVRAVRSVVSGHPDGRVGRMAAFHAARWSVARERFTTLQREYAAYEADPTLVAARPALTDVSVPATARFVQAFADAEYLATDTEPTGQRREEFAAAVDRAVAAWADAQRVADGLAAARPAAGSFGSAGAGYHGSAAAGSYGAAGVYGSAGTGSHGAAGAYGSAGTGSSAATGTGSADAGPTTPTPRWDPRETAPPRVVPHHPAIEPPRAAGVRAGADGSGPRSEYADAAEAVRRAAARGVRDLRARMKA